MGGDVEVYLIVIQRAIIHWGTLGGDLNATNLSAADESTHTFLLSLALSFSETYSLLL